MLRALTPSFFQRSAADGYDETLVPLDYQQSGQIRDDDLFKTLVGGFKEGVTVTFVMDCCHSGSVLDLPFQFAADGQSDQMTLKEGFDFGPMLGLAQQMMADGEIDAGDIQQIMAAAGCCTVL